VLTNINSGPQNIGWLIEIEDLKMSKVLCLVSDEMDVIRPRLVRYIALLLSFSAYGLAAATFGSSIAVLARAFSLSPIEIGELASAAPLGFLATFPGGILFDRLGGRKILSMGLALCSVGLAAIGTSNSFMSCLGSAGLVGIGSGFYEAAINPLVLELFPGRRALALGSAHATYGLGAFVGPLLVGYAYSTYVDRRLAFYVTSVIMTVALIVFLTIRLGGSPGTESNDAQQDFKLFDLKPLSRLMVADLLAWGVETSITAWLIVFLTRERELGLLLATTSLSIFFLLFAAGRPFWGLFADKHGYVRTVRICAVPGGVLLFLAISVPSGVLPMALIAMTGFFLGGVVPNITTEACGRLKSASGAASGAVNFGGNVGAILLPFMFGVVVLFSGAYWGFVLVSSLAILVALIAN
jgi:DHA1 family purine base/nucleoside efflux pump-like MFS transporter